MRSRSRGCRLAAGAQRAPPSLWDSVTAFVPHGLRHVLCTDIERDGALAGPNIGAVRRGAAAPPAAAVAGLGRHRERARPGRARRPPACRPRSAARRCWRSGFERRSCAHSCQTHNSLPRRARRPGGQGRALPRPPRGRRHPRARRALPRRGRRRTGVLRHHREPRGPLGRSRVGQRASHAVLDIPFCVAGGIRSVADAEEVLNAGAEKVSVNSPALRAADADRCAQRALRRAVRRRRHRQPGHGRGATASTSSPAIRRARSRPPRDTLDWVREVQQRGAGEIVLNCMSERRHARRLRPRCSLQRVRALCGVPLVASGGAGTPASISPRSSSRRASMRRSPRACSTAARLRSRISSGSCARAASRCDFELHRGGCRSRRLGQGRGPGAGHRAARRQRRGADARLHEPRGAARQLRRRTRRVLQPHAPAAVGKGRDLGASSRSCGRSGSTATATHCS